ncbi:MAG: hypothetical protein JWR33_2561 [Naasia sp.]|nr:hypothetical protein [Naasia sp.]
MAVPDRRLPRRLAGSLGAAALLASALAGCAPAVDLDPAEDAADVACASIVVRLPASLGDAARRDTDAQGTAAWGDPAAVLLHCGVPVPGPTTARCVSVNGVDWVEDATDAPVYTYTTYGRDPATSVTIDSAAASGYTVLTDLSEAVKAEPGTDACVGAEDVQAPAGTGS